MTTTYHQDIQQLYVAYFNRPADKAGLAFWETIVEAGQGDTSAISAAFAASNEYQTHYAGMTSHQIVAEVYANLFGRAPEQAGLDFWANGMDAGLFTIDNAVTAIAAGAQGSDLTAYNNKVTAATRFTDALDTDSEIGKYGNAGVDINARAKVFLDGITDDASLAAYLNIAGIDDAVLTVLGRETTTPTTPTTPVGSVPGAPAPSAPIVPSDPAPSNPAPAPSAIATLTTGDDDISGTAADDVIVAATDAASGILVLNGHDKIDGGAGIDTIKVSSTVGGVMLDGALGIRNVEKLSIDNAAGAVDADVSAWTGLQAVSVKQLASGETVKLTTSDNVASVSVGGGDSVQLVDAGSQGALAMVSFDATTGSSQVKSNALASVSMANMVNSSVYVEASAAPHTLRVTLDHVASIDTNYSMLSDTTATTVKLTATGAASSIMLDTTAATRIDIDGDQYLTIQLPDRIPVESVYTVTNSAGVAILGDLGTASTFRGGSGADQINLNGATRAIDMGAGDDTVTMFSQLGAGGSVAGGSGTDTLKMSTATAHKISAVDAAISGFEILDLQADGSSAKLIDLAKFNGDVNRIILDGNNVKSSGGVAGLTFTNLANNATLELTGPNGTAMDVQVGAAAAGNADVLNIQFNSWSEMINNGTLTAANIETVNVLATDTMDGKHLTGASRLKLIAADATKLTVGGSHGVDFTGSTLGKVVDLDASGVRGVDAIGSVTFASQVTDQAVRVKTAAGNDVIDLRSVTSASAGATVDTGAGDDRVWGSAGNDIVTLGAGRDTFNSSAGKDVITLGDGNDVYVLRSATDSAQGAPDTITDFMANTVPGATTAGGATVTMADLNGDTIWLKVGALATAGIAVSVVNSESEALSFLHSTSMDNDTHTTGIALDSATGKLYIDMDADGGVDSVIVLTGVTTITEAAFVVAH